MTASLATAAGAALVVSRRAAIAAFVRTAGGTVAVFAAIWLAVFVLDGSHALPAAATTKDRAVGEDMLWAVEMVVGIASLLTLARSAGEAPTRSAQPPPAAPLGDVGSAATPPTAAATAPADGVPVTPAAVLPPGEPAPVPPPACAAPVFMSLDVCNEMKGACMTVFLLYHYWDVKAVYNPVRVLVAVFLFLTGYGNYLSLSATPPSAHKLALSFLRINLLAAVVMSAARAPWMLYYICPLHTWWTVVVYAYFAAPPAAATASRAAAAAKLAVLTAAHVAVFEVPAVRDALFWPLTPALQYRGTMHEWGFRVTLDAYAPLFGMWVAFARPPLAAALARLQGRRVATAAVAAAAAAALWVHAAALYPLDKLAYNAVHRWSAWLPIAAACVLRNVTQRAATHYSRLLAAVGSCSLDLYLLQFHLWLAHSARDILAPLPGARTLSFAVQTVVFLVTAWAAAQAQAALLAALAKRRAAALTAAAALAAALTALTYVAA